MSNLNQVNQQLAEKVATELLEAIQTDPTCVAPVFPTVAGKSAYDIAVEHGFVGSETTWLNSLKVKGDTGEAGPPGPVGSVDLQVLTNWFYPVGIIIDFGSASFDPNTKYTGTTWVRHGEGKASVGLSTQSGDPSWTKNVGSSFGSYTHTLSVAEMPSHNHNNGEWDAILIRSGEHTYTNGDSNSGEPNLSWAKPMTDIGSNQAHNNVQPSIVDARWRRTA